MGVCRLYLYYTTPACGGYETIDKVRNGSTYDIIFMDHMMPEIDGIETTKQLREMGYNGVIVALTANALVGNNEHFRQNGFDDFISKPIDVRHLNVVLNKFVRDKHPHEAKLVKAAPTENVEIQSKEKVSLKLLEVFCRDSEKAITALRKTLKDNDLKLFTTNAHAMKSALANIGEHEISKWALELENAGNNADLKFILDNTENFITALEKIIKRIKPAENRSAVQEVTEDTDLLKVQLMVIMAACEEYDDATAYKALDLLQEKPWKTQTTAKLDKIRDMIYLHSDFDSAADYVLKMAEKL